MSLLKSRLHNVLWVFFEKFGLIALSFVSFFIFAIYLTPTQLGIGVLLLSLAEFISMFLIATVDNSMIRLKHISSKQDGTAFWLLMLVSVLLAGILFCGYYLYFEDAITLWVGLLAVMLLPIQAASRVHIIHLRRKKAFKSLAQRTIAGKLVGMAVGIWLAVYGFGEFAIVSQVVVMAAISTVLLLLMEPRKLPFAFDFKWAYQQIRIGVPASLKVLNSSLYMKGTIVSIEGVLGSASVGYYNFANRLVELPKSAILSALMSYAHPVFSDRVNQNENIERFFLISTKIALLVIMPFFIGLALIGDSLVEAIFGQKWLPSIDVLIGIAIITAVNLCFMFVPSVLIAHGKTKYGLKGQLLASICALIFLVFTLKDLGLVAVIYAFAIRTMIIIPVNLMAMSRVCPGTVWAFIKSCMYASFASVMMWCTVKYVGTVFVVESHWIDVAFTSLLGATVYLLVVFIVQPRILAEVKHFFSK